MLENETENMSDQQDKQDQTPLDPNRRRTEGYVIECSSTTAIITAAVDEDIPYMENYWAVGQQLSIWVGKNRVIAQSYKVESATRDWQNKKRNHVNVYLELIGEVQPHEGGVKFSTGISTFPTIGSIAHAIRTSDLAAIYENNADKIIEIGNLTQAVDIPAKIDVDKLLSRHFSVVGSTGVGKSTSVTLMLRKIIEARKEIRVLMLDPHNEFGSAFPESSLVIGSKELQLPFWMFSLEEIAEVIFRGQKGLELERELLRDLIIEAKEFYASSADEDSGSLVKKTKSKVKLSADAPVPYRMIDLLKVIEDRLGWLDNKLEKPMLKLLKDKITSVTTDVRFSFMFDPTFCGGDRMEAVLTKIFRLPQNGKPICVLEMSGLPSEVVSAVVSVLCRMAFELAISSKGAIQTLVVCEEAHRYIPADETQGFWPTRQAIGRIAKEGRKYGVYLGIITQRPGELDPTILSQCNSFFAMRLSNQKDQHIIAGAFNGGAQSTISFLPSIANRECIAFGEALHSPMRMTFETVLAKDLPGASIRKNQERTVAGQKINIKSVISILRNEVSQDNGRSASDDLDGSHNASIASDGSRTSQAALSEQPTIAELRAAHEAKVNAQSHNNNLANNLSPNLAPKTHVPNAPSISASLSTIAATSGAPVGRDSMVSESDVANYGIKPDQHQSSLENNTLSDAPRPISGSGVSDRLGSDSTSSFLTDSFTSHSQEAPTSPSAQETSVHDATQEQQVQQAPENLDQGINSLRSKIGLGGSKNAGNSIIGSLRRK
ncbi:MAG: ATP-binding protein [Nitratireductor sp.]